MSRRRKSSYGWLVVAMVFVFGLVSAARSDDDSQSTPSKSKAANPKSETAEKTAPDKGKAASTKSDKAADKSDSGKTAPKGNPYIPRQGMAADDLRAYIERMQEAPETIRTRPGFAEGMAIAAERILETKPTGTARTFAMMTLLDNLHQWADLEENKEAETKLAELSAALAKDSDKKIADAAAFYLLEQRVLKADSLDQTKLEVLLNDEKSALDGKPLDAKHVRIASATVHAINRIKNNDEHNRRLKEFGDLFAASGDPTLARYGRKVAATVAPAQPKTTDGVGKQAEISGTTAEGAKFNIEQYKGKVVLVLFWATWCSDCMAAMPSIKELYEKNKGQGFEIVGIDLDPNLADLGEYLEKQKLGWVNIIGEEKDGNMTFPIADKYELSSTPMTLVVAADGKIVARNLEGEALAKQIEKLLAAKAKTDAAKSDAKQEQPTEKPPSKAEPAAEPK